MKKETKRKNTGLGYASKNLNKLTTGYAWTPQGVLPVGVYTLTADDHCAFRVSHICGHAVDLYGDDIRVLVNRELDRNKKLAEVVACTR